MNNIEQMVKAQFLLYSNLDKLESIITAIESVLSPTMGEGNTPVSPEEEKAPKRWWEDYTWGEKDVGSLFYLNDNIFKADAVYGDEVIVVGGYEFEENVIERYADDIKLHFKPWIAEERKVPEDLAQNFAVLFDAGGVSIYSGEYDEINLHNLFAPKADPIYGIEVVGYCNLAFVNPILGDDKNVQALKARSPAHDPHNQALSNYLFGKVNQL